MTKSLQLHIPEPCHENWNAMTPREQGRFCGSCQKVVVDFSVMTDKEILDYFSKASEHVCGRFVNDQLNKDLVMTRPKKRVTLAYVWNMLLASLLMAKSYAQGQPQVKKAGNTTIVEARRMGLIAHKMEPEEAVIPVSMRGMVLDAQNNQPVMGASIKIKGTQHGTVAGSAGNFLLQIEKKENLELECSAIGYESQTLLMDKTTNWENVRVLLKPAINTLQEVTVVGYGTVKGRVMVMGSVTTIEKVNSNDWKPTALKNDVKIYPNPVMRGNSIQIKLSLPQAGEYKLELLNTVGQVMQVQPLFMQTKEQQVDLYTQTKWSAGIYWVRISSPGSKNIFEAKVLLQ
jgi:hypothetical protein